MLALHMVESMGVPPEDSARIFLGGVLADVGMVGLLDAIPSAPTPVLPEAALHSVRQHPGRSAATVRTIPYLEEVEPLVRHHHEWWDGTGYPDRLRGADIPGGALILRLADTVTALEEPRPHRPARTTPEVVEAVKEGAGSEFAPWAARHYLALQASGSLPPFQEGAYREAVTEAVDRLVPSRIRPLSVEAGLEILGSLIDTKDRYTGGHSRRVARLAGEVAAALGMSGGEWASVVAAGYLHDVGKLQISRALLGKQGGLTLQERERVEDHTRAGARLLRASAPLRGLAPGCLHHHERWDGKGYPDGLAGEAIPLVARILGVCDAYDAMTSGRSYGIAISREEALKEIRAGVGSHFCPRVARAFLSLPASAFVIHPSPPRLGLEDEQGLENEGRPGSEEVATSEEIDASEGHG